METKEIQNDCLEVLRAFDLYAKNNNLKYYMAGGTLLGAVRHQGFIPWDDDVDLMMPRKDYEFLIHHFHKTDMRFQVVKLMVHIILRLPEYGINKPGLNGKRCVRRRLEYLSMFSQWMDSRMEI